METRGSLYIIATPLGNLEDITLRALRVLREDVDVVFCEDTRQTRKLLNHYNIHLPLQSLHSHSSDLKYQKALDEISKGRSVAYLTDAGTPGISDPGSRLVNECITGGGPVIPLPGPSALSLLVSVTGFKEKNIVFAGFLSKKEGRRINELQKLKAFQGIIVLYESPHRIEKLLNAIKTVFPHNQLVIGREMTKIYEEFIRGTAEDILQDLSLYTLKGEFTVAIQNSM